MKKRRVFISAFTAVLLLTMVPAGEARGVETATGEYEIWGQRFVGDSRAFLPLVLRSD